MKVYVDELPKSCSYCACKCFETDTCQLNKGIKCPLENKIANKCPLQSLTDYTQQVRKEVCDEISKRMANEFPLDENEPMSCFEDHLYYQVLPDIIKGETNET